MKTFLDFLLSSPKICNIIISDYFHVQFNDCLFNFDKNCELFLHNNLKRINFSHKNNNFSSPKYLIGIIDTVYIFNNYFAIVTPLTPKTLYNKFSFTNYQITDVATSLKLNVDKYGIIYFDNKNCDWLLKGGKIQHIESKKFIGLDISYCLVLVSDETHASNFILFDNSLIFIKSELQVNFDLNNLKLNISLKTLHQLQFLDVLNCSNHSNQNQKLNICILLAAGNGSRFGNLKQIQKIDDKTVVEHCLDTITKICNFIIIVTNLQCNDLISNISKKYKTIFTVMNNENCRLKSIETALNYLPELFNVNDIDNILIHDSARPFVPAKYFSDLIELNIAYQYSQYSLKITGGLVNLNGEVMNRDKIIELCTPFCIKYKLFEFIFNNYIKEQSRITWEFIPILNILKIDYKLMYGNLLDLRKITFLEDFNKLH